MRSQNQPKRLAIILIALILKETTHSADYLIVRLMSEFNCFTLEYFSYKKHKKYKKKG